MLVKTTFAKRTISSTQKYVCKCGHKFTRRNSDHYYQNGFHDEKKTIKDMNKEVSTRKRPCPKCKSICKPTK